MKHKKTKLSVLLLALGLATQAQQAIVSAGGDATGSGGSVAYSMGQMAYTSTGDTGGTVSQGVQQAFEIFTLDVGDPTIDLELVAYPNPTTDYLTLRVGHGDGSPMRLRMYDTLGRLIEDRAITGSSETIQMGHLPRAMYLLKVTDDGNAVRTFKIIKN